MPKIGFLQLPATRFALHLLVDLVDHADAAGADGMAEALETAVGVHRQIALQRKRAVSDVGAGLTPGAEAQVLHDDQLGDGEAIVDHRHVDFGAGIGDAGLFVSGLARAHGFREIREVPVVAEGRRTRRRRGRCP